MLGPAARFHEISINDSLVYDGGRGAGLRAPSGGDDGEGALLVLGPASHDARGDVWVEGLVGSRTAGC